jgi:hypothetical protein
MTEHPSLAAAREAVKGALLAYTGYQLAWAANPATQPHDFSYAEKFDAALNELIRIAQLVGRAICDCESPTTPCYCQCKLEDDCNGTRLCYSCGARVALRLLA